MERIGLLGNKGCGKDTLADYLVKDKDFIKYNFATPIKEISKILFNLTDNQLYGNDKDIIDKRWNVSPRIIFQRIGTEFGQDILLKLFPELEIKQIWLKLFEIFLENNSDKNIVVSDVRFKHEVEYLKSKNFNIIKINRPNLQKDTHISENEINLIHNIDFTINNISSKDYLYLEFEKFIYVPF